MKRLLKAGNLSLFAISFAVAGCSVKTTGGASDGGSLLGKVGGGISGSASGASGATAGAAGTSGTSGTSTSGTAMSGTGVGVSGIGTSGASGTSGTSGGTAGASGSLADGGTCSSAPDDNACSACFKQSCCTQFSDCIADAACVACVNGTSTACLATNANAKALYQCQLADCNVACGGSGSSGSSTGSSGGTNGAGQIGDPCSLDGQCASGTCANGSWCSTLCATDQDCGSNSAGAQNFCEQGAQDIFCFPGCPSAGCGAFTGTTCKSDPRGVNVCSP